jgi:hypothetical protein
MTSFLLSVLALSAIAAFVWLARGVAGGSVPFLIAIVGFALNIVGAWLIAIGFTGRPFKALEEQHGVELFFHVLALNFLFLLGAQLMSLILAGSSGQWGVKNVVRFSIPGLRARMAALGIVGVITFGLYLHKLATNPLGVAFSGEHKSRQLALLRNSATAGFTGHYWRYSFAMSFILPFASWYFLCRMYNNERRYRLDWCWFGLFFVSSLYAAVVSLQKFPLLVYLVLTTLVFLESRRKKLRFSHLAILGVILIAVVSGMYTYFEAVKEPPLVRLQLAGNRTIIGQVYSSLAYLDIFPHRIGYLLGGTFPNPRGILPFVPFDFTHVGWTYLYPHHPHGLYGTANTVYFMEFYVNFGYLAMYAIAPITGGLVMLISNRVSAIACPEIRVPVSYLFGALFFRLSLTSFFQVFQEAILVLGTIGCLWLCTGIRSK